MKKNYHCCATCIHFLAKKEDGQMTYLCERLDFHTKTHYQFNCWIPKENVRRLMQKEK